MLHIFFLFICSILFPLTIQGQETLWIEDYKKAVEIAKQKNQLLLIAFLGPDECPWSQKLDTEVLSDQEFIDELNPIFTLVKVRLGNNALKEKYQVKELPLIMLASSSGEPIARTHYLPLSSADFLSYIKELLVDFQLIKMVISDGHLKNMPFEQLKTLYQKALRLENPEFKNAIVEKGLKRDRGAFFLLQQYGSMIETGKMKDLKTLKLRHKILSRDPKNEHGTHLKIALMEYQALMKKSKKPERVLRPLFEYTQTFGKKDHENLWKIEMMIAELLFSHNFLQDAMKHATLSYEAAPETERAGISQSIEYFKTHLPK